MATETNRSRSNRARKFKKQINHQGFRRRRRGLQRLDYSAAGFRRKAWNFIAVNTDAQALAHAPRTEKMTLGARLTRGLGTGGDPEMGRAAAEEDIGENSRFLRRRGHRLRGGRIGRRHGHRRGRRSLRERRARSGALVLGMVTLPFEFEASRRPRQAQAGLQQLKAAADGVICLPNQKLFKLIDENTSVLEGLKISNELLAQGVRGIWRLLSHTGLINVDFTDLCSVLRGRHEASSLATVEASGENRSHEIIEKLMAHPFLEGGQSLAEADAVLVSLAGGPDMTMAEINRVMEQINRQCENAHIIMGAAIQERSGGKNCPSRSWRRGPDRGNCLRRCRRRRIEKSPHRRA